MFLVYEINERAEDVLYGKYKSYARAIMRLKKSYPYLRRISTEVYEGYTRMVFQADIGSDKYFAIIEIKKGDDLSCRLMS